MANWYVNSAAGGTNAGTSWTNACTSLSQLLGLGTPPAAGDSIFIANTSAESYGASTILTFPGTVANPNFIYSTDTTNSPPTSADLLAGATVGAAAGFNITMLGSFYCYGVTVKPGTATGGVGAVVLGNTTTNQWQRLDTCKIFLNNTNAGSFFTIGQVAVAGQQSIRCDLINTTVKFGNVGQNIKISNCVVNWWNTASAIVSGTLPTNLFNTIGDGQAVVTIEGVDLSALGSGKTIIAANTLANQYYLKDCLLGSSVTLAGTPTNPGGNVFNIRSDSGNTNYRNEKYSYTGTETTETSITRVGGAAQADGTAFSRKYVATANAEWVLPFQGLPMAIWCPYSSGTHTVTIYGTWNSASVPNNDQIWCDVEYLGTSGNPLGVFATATKANNLASGTPLTADASTWNGGGSGAGWSPFSMQISFSPTEAGYIYIYPKVAAASDTFWLDPAIGLQ